MKSQVSVLKFSNENKSRGSHATSHKPNHLYGQIKYKRKPEELNFCRKKETLLNNSLTITHFNFTFNICKNIAFIFNNNINRLLKNCIMKVTNEKISTLFIKVSNIQYSRKLNFDQTTLVNTFLPKSQTFQAPQL